MEKRGSLMMVEQSRYVENVHALKQDLEIATKKLTQVSGKGQLSPEEVKEVAAAIQTVNSNLDPAFWNGKKFVSGMDEAIKSALGALALFHIARNSRNAEQAIISLFDSLRKELKDLDKNLRNLKKYKIGQRVDKVEQPSPSKSS